MPLRLPLAAVLAAAFLMTASAGCSSGDAGNSELVPVTGTVTYQGTPVADATVVFRSVDNSTSAFGKTNQEGVYTLSVSPTEVGAKPGEYNVSVEKVTVSGADQLPEDHPDYGKAPIVEAQPVNQLPAKYADPARSGLRFTVTADGENTIPLELNQ